MNIVGKAIKYVTGNMEADDEKEINDRLKELEDNEEGITNLNNKLVKFSTHLNSELSKITDNINNQTVFINWMTENFSRRKAKQAILFTRVGLLSSELIDPVELPDIDLDHY